MNYINKVVEDYNPETFQAEPILKKLEELYPNINSRSVKMSQLRSKLLLKTPLNGYDNMKDYWVEMRKKKQPADLLHPEIAKLKLTNQEYIEIVQKKKQAVKDKNDNTTVIKNSENLRKEILSGLNSLTYNKLFPALLLATGRRTIEILKTGKFRKLGDRVLFKGQAKTRKEKSFDIPLLAPMKDVQRGVKNLRRLFPEIKEDNLSNQQVQELVKNRNEELFKTISEKYGVKLTPHRLRGLYVAFAYKEYSGDASYIGFASRVLGHDDLETTLHYVDVKLK